MTSRRAQRRRMRPHAGVATVPAGKPGRELPRAPASLERWEPAGGRTVAFDRGDLDNFAMIPRAPGSTEPELQRAARLDGDALQAAMLAANWTAGDPAGLGYGMAAWQQVTRVTVPPDLRRDLVIGCGWPLECYERALLYLLDHHDHDVALTHGLVVERGRLWAHAWCEINGTAVYDPTTGEFYDLADYYRVLEPAALDRFTPEQAAARAIATGSAGPWRAPDRAESARYGAVIAGAVASLLESYTRTYPGVLAWVQRMRVADARFARELEELERDLLAVPNLLADLMEQPGLWGGHPPGAPWPYRLCRRPGHSRVVYPDT